MASTESDAKERSPGEGSKARKDIRFIRAFRMMLGAWLIASIWVLVNHQNALGVSNGVSGLAVIVLAILSRRRPNLCFAQIPVGLWVMASPFILDGGNEVTLYSEIITGKVLFLSGFAAPAMFDED